MKRERERETSVSLVAMIPSYFICIHHHEREMCQVYTIVCDTKYTGKNVNAHPVTTLQGKVNYI